jgi:hypothetical protein
VDDLDRWNSPAGLRASYGNLASGCVFFAQDLFGEQFCPKDYLIHRFEPETAVLTPLASDFEEWATLVLENHAQELGWPVAHDWQRANGPLARRNRLGPLRRSSWAERSFRVSTASSWFLERERTKCRCLFLHVCG